MEFDKVIKTRASIRKYFSKKIKESQVIDLIEAANLAPSPGNLPILRYIIVDDSSTIEKIAEACRQEFINQASVLVVVCSEHKRANIMFDERADKYIKQHAGASIENFLLKATEMGLASCWVGAFSDLTVRNILSIPEDITVEAILPVAYQSKIDKTKQRLKTPIFNKIYFNKWKNRYKKPFGKIGGH